MMQTTWHQASVATVCVELASTPDGLSGTQAAIRLATVGFNELPSADRVSPWRVLAAQFQNLLVLILLAAAALSALLGETLEALVIAVILLFAIILGFVQEYRAERSLEALRRMAAPTARVLRDGHERTLPARELVPGDLVLLGVGDRIPADLRLTEAVNLQVNEATLTGESNPVAKSAAALAEPTLPLGDRVNLAYAGTDVTYGRGRGLVIATGPLTQFGQVTGMLAAVKEGRTPLQQNLDRVGRVLALAAGCVVLLIAGLGVLRGEPLLGMFIFAVALAVAVVPEALPAVVTISLAIGVRRMVRRHALVRRLPTVETLGSISVILSDKTGTLTRDEMTVREVWMEGCQCTLSGSGYEPRGELVLSADGAEEHTRLRHLLGAAALSCDARLVEEEGQWQLHGDPTEGALIVAAAKAGLDRGNLERRTPRVAEIPFSSERKRMTTLHRDGDGLVACSKGAAEIILDGCTRVAGPGGARPLDAATRSLITLAAQAMATRALRVLAIAYKPDATLADAEQDMIFAGLVGMIDPPRAEAPAAIAQCKQAGIRPIMITGDHPDTAAVIARELGILRDGQVVTGTQLDDLSDDDLARAIGGIEVYARVSPQHKLRVVSAWQARGQVCAMTGDGVNDAPALKKADVGVAMGVSGTDVSREAADMTLTDDNFASIVAAVEEGRGIFSNIKKYLMYLLSSNIGEVGLMAVATLAGMPLPLSAVQILYVNLATDGLPALALAFDPPAPDLMRRPPRDPSTGLFTPPVVALILVGGVWSTLVNCALFAWELQQGEARGLDDAATLSHAMTMTFLSLVLIQFFKAYSFRSDRDSVFIQPFANRWLNVAILWELTLLLLLVYVPVLATAFGTYRLAAADWFIVTATAATVVPVLELAKWLIRRLVPADLRRPQGSAR
jgi:P-type Ca2+ transporter type 2C